MKKNEVKRLQEQLIEIASGEMTVKKVYAVITEIRRHNENEILFRDINLEDRRMVDAIAYLLEHNDPNNDNFDIEEIVNIHSLLLDIYSDSLHKEGVNEYLYLRYNEIIDYILALQEELFDDNG